MHESRDQRFEAAARTLGHRFDGELKVGGHYAPVARHDTLAYVSGQMPRIGDRVAVTGMRLPKRAAVELDVVAAAVAGVPA